VEKLCSTEPRVHPFESSPETNTEAKYVTLKNVVLMDYKVSPVKLSVVWLVFT